MVNKKQNSKTSADPDKHTETRHVVIYGYTKQEINKILKHFAAHLPEYVKISIDTSNLVTKITLTGVDSGVELLRFNMNRYHSTLNMIFSQDVVAMEDTTIAQTLGELLHERELTVSCAESCTGGNLAHRIVQVPGSSSYFLGSVVSYANDVKTNVLKVPKEEISRHGAVSKTVVEAMAKGVAKLMRTDCAIATSGIAGPDGGTSLKPVGTVWFAAKYGDTVVSECIHFKGDRNTVIESATNHGMVMLINLLKNCYVMQEDVNDD